MKTGLSIGLHIREVLTSSSSFRAVAGERVYSFPAEQDAALPYVTYSMSNLSPDYTKDGWEGDSTAVTVEIVAHNATEATNIAEVVREVLEEKDEDYLDWSVSAGVLARAVSGYNLDLGLSVVSMEYTFVVK